MRHYQQIFFMVFTPNGETVDFRIQPRFPCPLFPGACYVWKGWEIPASSPLAR